MESRPVGGQWLKERFNLVNYTMTHSSYIADNPDLRMTLRGNIERDFGPKYAVTIETDPLHHIEFYLKYDHLNLDFLQVVFRHIPSAELAAFISKRPAGISSRRIGFFYEFLTGHTLNLHRAVSGNYIDLLDEDKYVTGKKGTSTRWRVYNNLLGTADYCPIVRRTKELQSLLSYDLTEEIQRLKANYPEDIFRRATNYLYTKETKSSYEIEKEKPSPARTQRFIALLQRAGAETDAGMLEKKRLVSLQNAIVDDRFADVDFRNHQNYVGGSLGDGQENFHYICPPPQLVPSLMKGLQDLAVKTPDTGAEIRAGLIAFGFVFIHPFEDGNGRLHRFLIHDVLAHDKKVPQGIIIPVSAHMLNNIKEYDAILEKYSKPLMQRVKFTSTDIGSVVVANPTEVEGYFKYPELTDHCVYLSHIIRQTVKEDMPKELTFVQRFDEVKKAVQAIVDMPDKMISLMITLLHQNKGVLSKRKREEFAKLTDEEILRMEQAYQSIFEIN